MPRNFNTNFNGYGWPESIILAVWEQGIIHPEYNANTWRKDVCGNWMKRTLHGKQEKYGWEIDHIKPVSKGGSDDLSNLQPLYWENNRKKGDIYPWDKSMC